MAGYIKGNVRQLTPEHGLLKWDTPKPWTGNEIKFTSLSEIDMELDTTRFHISLPVSGKEPYVVDGKNYTAEEGEYFVFNPKQTARAAGIFEEKAEGYCIFLTEKLLQETARGIGLSVEKTMHSPFDYSWQQQEFMVKTYRLEENSFGQYLYRLKQRLIDQVDNSLIDWDTFYFDLAASFLQTHRQIGKQLQAIPSTRIATKQEIYRRLSLAHCFILENYADPISLDDLEKVAFFSKYHILRLYRQIYGLTPYQHILKLRIEKAKQLLRKNYSPSEVAQRLSFSDRRAFAKGFKKLVGVAPSVYMKNSN